MRIRKFLRVENENENESSQKKIESRDREWDESFPWESQFWDRDESLAEVCFKHMIKLNPLKQFGKILWIHVIFLSLYNFSGWGK